MIAGLLYFHMLSRTTSNVLGGHSRHRQPWFKISFPLASLLAIRLTSDPYMYYIKTETASFRLVLLTT